MADDFFIEKQIIPEFTQKELYKARKPVSHTAVYPKPGRLHLPEIVSAPKESWWEKNAARNNFKGFKNALQTMLNF